MAARTEEKVEVRPSHPDCPFVTKFACGTRTRAARWVVGVLFGILGVFLALVVCATAQSKAANTNYIDMHDSLSTLRLETHGNVKDVKASVETHKMALRAADAAIIEKLNEVKTELVEQRKEQRDLLERILELQIEVAKKSGTAP